MLQCKYSKQSMRVIGGIKLGVTCFFFDTCLTPGLTDTTPNDSADLLTDCANQRELCFCSCCAQQDAMEANKQFDENDSPFQF